MANWLRSGPHFGIKLNGQGVEVNFALFRETFVLFDLDIDLFFTTEVTILADQSAQATPSTIYITDFSRTEDSPLSTVDRWIDRFQLFTRCCSLFMMLSSQPCFMVTEDVSNSRPDETADFQEINQCILSDLLSIQNKHLTNLPSSIIISLILNPLMHLTETGLVVY